jgi:hypothetical protein
VHIDLVLLPQAGDKGAEPEGSPTPFMEMNTAEDALMTERSWFERRHTLLLRLLVRHFHRDSGCLPSISLIVDRRLFLPG